MDGTVGEDVEGTLQKHRGGKNTRQNSGQITASSVQDCIKTRCSNDSYTDGIK